MPYRAYHVALGVVGVAAVLVLVILRSNLDHHARTGPRWKRRVVNAGLLLLAALGFGPATIASCDRPDPAKSGYSYPEKDDQRRARRRPTLRADKRAAPRPNPPRPVTPRPHVEKRVVGTSAAGIHMEPPRPEPPKPPTPHLAAVPVKEAAPFTLITKSHDEAVAVVSGVMGSAPFDKACKKRMLAELLEAQASCDVLRKAGQVTAAEAALMKQRLARLHSEVARKRPEGRGAACYRPRPREPEAVLSLSRLTKRLPHLRRLAAVRRLHPDVVTKVLAALTRDLKVLQNNYELSRLKSDADRRRAARVAKQVRRQVDRVRKQLQRPPEVRPGVARSPQWKVFVKAWGEVSPLTDQSRRTTSAEHRAARAWLKSARQAAADLVTARLLTTDESQLLRVELARLGMLLGRNRPTDSRIRCYRPAPFRPRRNSKARLVKRQTILLKIVKRGRISKAVRDRVLPSLERDLALIAKPGTRGSRSLDDLLGKGQKTPPPRVAADPFVRQMRKLLARVKRLPTRK